MKVSPERIVRNMPTSAIKRILREAAVIGDHDLLEDCGYMTCSAIGGPEAFELNPCRLGTVESEAFVLGVSLALIPDPEMATPANDLEPFPGCSYCDPEPVMDPDTHDVGPGTVHTPVLATVMAGWVCVLVYTALSAPL